MSNRSNTESLQEFYQHKFNFLPNNLQQDIGHFNVFRLEDCVGPHGTPVKYRRRDFYKITLIRGENIYHYADKSLRVNGSTLLFTNPQVPYTWENVSGDSTGFFCIFSETFFSDRTRNNLNELPMYAPGGKPAYLLTPEQDAHVSVLYQKMLEEINSDYIYKYDLLRNYVMELTHFAIKTQPSENLYQHPDANSRICAVFTELLERQFPIESPSQRFMMRSAKDFAAQLSVHVNHLNRAIRVTTGKTTTERISERLVSEAKSLLRHTDWNVSEIGYCLGFEEPSHFNNFFKKHTSITPSAYRVV
ncbi:MAG TPA: helix-turn-helix transcriptional regulator [Chitinophaga sp.]|uniref:helix-turn-helix domain-containing protein n=1 Tax=Chitinophaga sp. TaxID=1869181 RepID=UPI002DBA2293|nr:helix-turn-helix transcriptional regulator [Chitinophaga sp.]HEU4554116.1 helix-turn-helix transcriptional regulator [Chitinophaga sp.]